MDVGNVDGVAGGDIGGGDSDDDGGGSVGGRVRPVVRQSQAKMFTSTATTTAERLTEQWDKRSRAWVSSSRQSAGEIKERVRSPVRKMNPVETLRSP